VSKLLENTAFDLFYRDDMAATLAALDATGGDLSGGERRFMTALAKVKLDSPLGPIRLDARHEAIGSNYLARFSTWFYAKSYSIVHGVDHTFGGYFGPNDPPPGETTPTCKAGKTPPWAR
jgi:hypothetical protein